MYMGVEGVEVVWVYGLMDKYVDLWTCIWIPAALSQVILCNITQPLCFTKSLEITLYQSSFFESPFGNVEFHSTPALLPCLPSCLPACSAKTAKFRDRKREREREKERKLYILTTAD